MSKLIKVQVTNHDGDEGPTVDIDLDLQQPIVEADFAAQEWCGTHSGTFRVYASSEIPLGDLEIEAAKITLLPTTGEHAFGHSYDFDENQEYIIQLCDPTASPKRANLLVKGQSAPSDAKADKAIHPKK